MHQLTNLDLRVKASGARLRRRTKAGRVHVVTQNHDLLGIRSGDALMWDDKAKPIAGDFVLVASGRVAGGALRPTIFLPMKHPTKMALVNAATQGR